jgi:hypothetical protein
MAQPMDKAEAFDLLFAFVTDLAITGDSQLDGNRVGRESASILARIAGHEYDPGEGYNAEAIAIVAEVNNRVISEEEKQNG